MEAIGSIWKKMEATGSIWKNQLKRPNPDSAEESGRVHGSGCSESIEQREKKWCRGPVGAISAKNGHE
jgi:hypothetical protein